MTQRLSAGSGHRHRVAPAAAGGIPAPDHRHAHTGRPRAGRRAHRPGHARPRRACSAGSGWRPAARPARRPAGPRRPASGGSAACSAGTRAADAPAGRRRPGIDTRPWATPLRSVVRRHGAGHPPDVDHTASLAAARVRRFLEQEPVVWLSTVRPNGDAAHRPDLVLVGRRGRPGLLEARRPEGPQHPRANPAVMLARRRSRRRLRRRPARGSRRAPGSTDGRRDARAPTSRSTPSGWRAIGLTADEYAATYSQVIRIVPDHYLGWHGRTIPPAHGSPVRRPSRSTSRAGRAGPGR